MVTVEHYVLEIKEKNHINVLDLTDNWNCFIVINKVC